MTNPPPKEYEELLIKFNATVSELERQRNTFGADLAEYSHANTKLKMALDFANEKIKELEGSTQERVPEEV